MATDILKGYSKSKVEGLRDTFRLFDKDGDGSISTDELSTIMRSLGQFPSCDELDQMIRDVDINGDGQFSFDEFAQVMINMGGLSEDMTEQDEEEELRQAFKMFDKSGSGFISAQDLRGVLQCMGQDLTEDEIDDMIAEVDIDGDGRIDFEEFIACMGDDKSKHSEEERVPDTTEGDQEDQRSSV